MSLVLSSCVRVRNGNADHGGGHRTFLPVVKSSVHFLPLSCRSMNRHNVAMIPEPTHPPTQPPTHSHTRTHDVSEMLSCYSC